MDLDGLDAALRAAGSPERAVQEQRYLKSSLAHYGASVPAIRRAVKEALRSDPPADHDALLAAVEQLWDQPAGAPVHERRMAAVELLTARVGDLGPADLALVERLVRESGTWALVDGLAASVAGQVLVTHPDHPVVTGTLDRWAADDDFWVRRTALLVHLPALRVRTGPAEGDPHAERFLRYADAMLGEREFFVRKAIGWVLRDAGRRRPELVTAWLLPRARLASGLTVREAVKHLPEAQREAVLAARAA